MGILDTIKDLFNVDNLDEDIQDKKVKEKEEEMQVLVESEELATNIIEITQIKEKLDIQKKEVEDLTHKEREAMHNAIATFVEDLDNEVKRLEKVDLSQKNGDDRLRQATETGRKEYISNVLKLIAFLQDRQKDVTDIRHYLERFFQMSGKSYERTTLLIGREIEGIVSSISGINKIIDKYKLDNIELISKERRINEAFEKYDERTEAMNKKNDVHHEIENIERKLVNRKEEMKEVDKKIEKIKLGEEYNEKHGLMEEKKEIESEINSVKSDIEGLIDERVFRKYVYLDKKTENAKLVNRYLENPVEGLIYDENLELLKVFEDIKEKINFGIIILKEPGKMVFKLNTPEDVFVENRDKIIKLRDEIDSINNRVGELDKTVPDLSELEKEKENFMEKISTKEKYLVVLKERVDQIDEKISELDRELGLFVEV